MRFVQVYASGHGTWDSHQKLKENHAKMCASLDKPVAGLMKDLKQRGLLDETVVVFCTEFGRTLGLEQRGGGKDGRDHHPHGEGHYVTDLHATVGHLLGMDMRRLEVPGRKRLEIDHGKVISEILA